MKYVTGQHALNVSCSLLTCGDWHQSALQWESPFIRESADSVFGDYGIEHDVTIPEHTEKYNVANHIRALLDLLELGKFTLAQGMNNDFICNDDYTNEIFNHVILLSSSPIWPDIDHFMGKEYFSEWLNYKRGEGKPLKIEVSFRGKEIDTNEITLIDGIRVYKIETLCMMKANAYTSRDRIRDLYDLTFICNNYYDQLSAQTISLLRNTLEYKGIEQFDYIIKEQHDEGKLAGDFLSMFDKLGLFYNEKERQIISSIENIR